MGYPNGFTPNTCLPSYARGVGIEPTRRGFGDLPDALSVPRKLPDLARDRHRIRTPTEIQTPIFPLEGERPVQLDDGGK